MFIEGALMSKSCNITLTQSAILIFYTFPILYHMFESSVYLSSTGSHSLALHVYWVDHHFVLCFHSPTDWMLIVPPDVHLPMYTHTHPMEEKWWSQIGKEESVLCIIIITNIIIIIISGSQPPLLSLFRWIIFINYCGISFQHARRILIHHHHRHWIVFMRNVL